MYKNIFIDRPEEGSPTVYIFDDTRGVVTLPWSQFAYSYVPDGNGNYITMTGVRVSKKPNSRTKLLKDTFETDVPMDMRVLTDLYLNEDEPSIGNVTMYFDIEVSMENGIPDINVPNNEVTAIAAYDNASKEYIMFVLDKDSIADTSKFDPMSRVYLFDNEINLLHAFMEYYEQVAPSIITGWNSDKFDVPYLYNRIRQQCGLSTANRLSPIGKVKYSDFRSRYVIAGVSSLDYLDLYKKFTYNEQPSFRLDAIGKFELGEGKIEYEGTLDDLFKNDINKFIEYNLQDVKIVVKLDDKLKLIELVRGMCHVGHVPYEDYSLTSRVLEGSILTYLHRKKIIATNKPEGGRDQYNTQKKDKKKGFAGAFVRPPLPGLYDWVYSLDLQSLYPSIIMSLNISPETKIGKVLNWNIDEYNSSTMDSFVIEEADASSTLNRKQFDAYLKQSRYMISINGILYRASDEKIGVIPAILDKWFYERKEYKELQAKAEAEGDSELGEFYDRRQHIQKILLNSLYGVLGLPTFRFYDVDNALAVTASGQEVIKRSVSFTNDLYVSKKVEPRSVAALAKYWTVIKEDAKRKKAKIPPYPSENDHCIYIDTDSLYFSSEPIIAAMGLPRGYDEDKNFTIKLAKTIEQKLNAYYDELANTLFFCKSHRLYIKGESIAQSGLWIAKKRYALDKVYDLEKNKDVEKLIVKGMDIVRSTFPTAFREYMKNLLISVLRKEDKLIVDSSILAFRKDMETMKFRDVARNTAVKNISKYELEKDTGINEFMSTVSTNTTLNSFNTGSPMHVKAAMSYNKLLHYFKIDSLYEKIEDGSKVQYVFLDTNPLGIETMAIKGYNDPPEIIDYIEAHISYKSLFDNELRNKLNDFYVALGWGLLPTEINQNASNFFEF